MNVISHINRIENKNQIIVIGAGKTFNKIQHSFIIKFNIMIATPCNLRVDVLNGEGFLSKI